jgi:hypothetical protein
VDWSIQGSQPCHRPIATQVRLRQANGCLHDPGSQSNETDDGLDSNTEALRHATEDTASDAAPDDVEKTPVFDRAGLAPKI